MSFFSADCVVSSDCNNLNLACIQLPSSCLVLFFPSVVAFLVAPAPVTWWRVWDHSRCLNLSGTFSTWRILLKWIYIIKHDYPGLEEQYTEQYGLCGICWQSCPRISVHIFNSVLDLLLIEYLVLLFYILESKSQDWKGL